LRLSPGTTLAPKTRVKGRRALPFDTIEASERQGAADGPKKERRLMRTKIYPLLAAMVLAAMPLWAQTNPTGTISGKVVDSDGLAVPGATVTAESPALQGTRTVTTSANGDYIVPFLPAGEYSVTVTLTGFRTVKQTARVSPSESVTLNPTLAVSTVSETVTVVGQAPGEFGQQAEVATNFKADLIDKLPTNRTVLAAALLTPGVQGTGPNGGLSINGAMSFESLYVVNGVVVNENIRGQPNVLFIEDALQETTVTTAAVSAEFGRFQGGVVQAITKSGGNEFSGSYRMTFDNNDWVKLTPFPNDKRTDKMLYTQEATLGGPILKDKLWFFGAARLTGDRVTNGTTFATNQNFDDVRNQKRFEGKLTYALNSNHTFKGAYSKINDTEDGNFFGNIMDFASLVNGRATPQELISANYTGIISPKFFIEGQYSRRKFTFINSGSLFTDIIKGTLLIDQSRNNARYNSPTFCGVCDPEKRDNQNITAKATYFASTGSLGSHNVVAGFDLFDDKRFANNHQSGSDFRVLTTSAIIQGTTLFPVLDDRSIIRWTPIFVGSEGNRFRTYSGFINDAWSLNKHWNFNVGLRYDKNSGIDSQGNAVVKDSKLSPRLSATFDPKGTGEWTINAAYAQYVAAIANSIGDSGSAGGQPATIDFSYLGPPVNTGSPANPVPTSVALQTLFDWFNANGGTNRATRGAPSIPGLNVHINQSLSSPNSQEVTLGLTRRIGNKGSVRVDGIYRKYQDFYITRIDHSTGKVQDQFGRSFDLGIVENNNDLDRSYRGLDFQAAFRPTARLGLSGNYTLSELKGNVEGENGGSGPTTATSQIIRYPEYYDPSWNFTDGDLNADVRHKVRAWATYDVPLPATVGNLTVGVLQYFNSGSPYGALGTVDTRPFVAGNPLGYSTPPATVPYLFTARDAFHTDKLWRTDLAVNYAHKLGFKKSELFGRFTTVNLFNRQGLTNLNGGTNSELDLGCGTGGCISTTVLSNANNATVAPFNPFTTTPVEGVNWKKAPTFGQPTSRFAYQTPRTIQFALGVRF
jgi:Carboxypeptidase regulatory-like domain/TonB dependent receptor